MSQRTLLICVVIMYLLFMVWLISGCTTKQKPENLIMITSIDLTSDRYLRMYEYREDNGVTYIYNHFVDSANKYHVGLNTIK